MLLSPSSFSTLEAILIPLHLCLRQPQFESPLLLASFQLPGHELDDQVLQDFLLDSSHQLIDSYAADRAALILRDGKPATFSVLTRVVNPAEFAGVIEEFDTLFFTLAEPPQSLCNKLCDVTLYTQDGERAIKINRKTGGYISRFKVPDVFISAL